MAITCATYDKAFRAAEQQISQKIIEKKFKLGQNAYWGRVPDGGMFPEHAGLTIKKIRLARTAPGTGKVGWEKMIDDGCNTNVCARPQAEGLTHGSSDITFSLERFRVVTDKICLSLLPYRQMAEKELMHMESNLVIHAQHHWNEYLRTRYIYTSENKYVAMVSDDALDADNGTCDIFESACDPIVETQGFVFWHRGPSGPVIDTAYSIDERYVSVNVPPDKIANIAELSGDLLEMAALNLQYEDENMPFIDQGMAMYDLILPDIRMGRRLRQLERSQESECVPTVMWEGKNLSRSLGIKTVVRENFGVRYDNHGLKFYPDDVYNATLSSGAYDSNNPLTWPRFVRVYAYYPVALPNGTVDWKPNKYYQRAPFGISSIFTPTVMSMVHPPEAKSVGSAKVGEMARDYAGRAKWVNKYDKDCNPDEEIGHWEMHFGAGIEPDRPENGNVFFHRIDGRVRLAGSPCPIPLLGNYSDNISLECYDSVQTGEAALGVTAGSLGANVLDVHVNGYPYLI